MGTIQADIGNTLSIAIGGSAAFFNVGTLAADGGTVIVTASPSALAGGFMPVRGFYEIEGGGTLVTQDYFPASNGLNGTHEEYEFADSTAGNTLKIENAESFGGAILNFAAGDTIDLGTLQAVGTIAYSTATNLLSLEAANGTTLATLLLGNAGTGIAGGTFAVTGGSADGISVDVVADGDTELTTSNSLLEASGISGTWQSSTSWTGGIMPGTAAAPVIGLGALAPFTLTTGGVPVSVGGFGVDSPSATVLIDSNTTLTSGQISDYAGTVDIATGTTLTGGAIQLYTAQRLVHARRWRYGRPGRASQL